MRGGHEYECENVRIRKEMSWFISRYYLGICLASLRKITKISVRRADNPPQTRTGYLRNTHLDRSCSVFPGVFPVEAINGLV